MKKIIEQSPEVKHKVFIAYQDGYAKGKFIWGTIGYLIGAISVLSYFLVMKIL